MTLPALHKRSTAEQRRQQRAEFAQLKEEQRAARQPINRHRDYRHTLKEKLRNLSRGTVSLVPFTRNQLGVLKRSEFDMIDAVARARLARLSAEERANIVKCLCLLLVLPKADDWAAFVDYANGRAG